MKYCGQYLCGNACDESEEEDEDEDEEEDGIGCNECYACVTGGAGPSGVKDK